MWQEATARPDVVPSDRRPSAGTFLARKVHLLLCTATGRYHSSVARSSGRDRTCWAMSIHLLACTVGGRVLASLVLTVLFSAATHLVLFSRITTLGYFRRSNGKIGELHVVSNNSRDKHADPLSRAMDEAVGILYGPNNVNAAEEYIHMVEGAVAMHLLSGSVRAAHRSIRGRCRHSPCACRRERI